MGYKLMPRLKVNKRYQVVIPKEIRETLNLKPSNYLDVKIVDRAVVMMPQASHTSRLFGKHREVWQGEDAVAYVRGDRDSWRD